MEGFICPLCYFQCNNEVTLRDHFVVCRKAENRGAASKLPDKITINVTPGFHRNLFTKYKKLRDKEIVDFAVRANRVILRISKNILDVENESFVTTVNSFVLLNFYVFQASFGDSSIEDQSYCDGCKCLLSILKRGRKCCSCNSYVCRNCRRRLTDNDSLINFVQESNVNLKNKTLKKVKPFIICNVCHGYLLMEYEKRMSKTKSFVQCQLIKIHQSILQLNLGTISREELNKQIFTVKTNIDLINKLCNDKNAQKDPYIIKVAQNMKILLFEKINIIKEIII